MQTPYSHINPNINKDYVDGDTDKDALWKIENWLFECKTEQINLLSKEHIGYHGIRSSGDEDIDKTMMHMEVPIQLTVVQLSNYYNDGIEIKLMKPERSLIIYELIREVFDTWVYYLRVSPFPQRPPMDDLSQLDSYAKHVWEYAKWYYPDKEAVSRTAVESVFKVFRGGMSSYQEFIEEKVKEAGNYIPPSHNMEFNPPTRHEEHNEFNKLIASIVAERGM